MEITNSLKISVDPCNFSLDKLADMSTFNIGLMIADLKMKAANIARDLLMIDVPMAQVVTVNKCILDLTMQDLVSIAIYDPLIYQKVIAKLQAAIKSAVANGSITLPSITCTCPACNGSGVLEASIPSIPTPFGSTDSTK